MKDQKKTKDQLSVELKEMHQRVAELEENETRGIKVQEALRESEERFRATFEQAAVGITHVSPEGRFLRINQKFCDIVGYSRDEILQLKYQNITHPDDLDVDVDRAGDLLSGKSKTDVLEKRYIHKNGEPVWVHLTVSLVRDEAGQPKWFIAVIQDITERKEAEEKLRESKERFEKITSQSPIPMVITDSIGNVEYFNDKFIKTYGHTMDDISTAEQWWIAAYPDEDYRLLVRRSWEKAIAEAAEKGTQIETQEWDITCKDSSVRHVEFNMMPLGEISVIAMNDITERKQVADALRESEMKYRLLSTNTLDTIWTTDLEFNITFISNAVFDFLGYTPQEFLGRNPTDFTVSEDMPALERAANELIVIYKEGEIRQSMVEVRQIRKDGTIIDVELTANLLQDRTGQVIGFQGRSINITERKQKEKALRLTQASVDNLMDAVYWMGADAKFIYVNSAAVEALGYSKEELLTMTVHDIGPEFPKEVWPEHWADLKERKSFVLHTNHRRKDGSIFPVDISVNLIEFGGTEINCAIARDVSERKKAEAELSEAYNIINRSPVVAFLWKNVSGWPVVFASENVDKLTGYSAREFTEGKASYGEMIHMDDRERVASEVMSNEANVEVQTFVHEPYRIITKNGETKWVSDATYIRRDSGGVITHFEGIVIDLTERLKLEDQLRQAQKMESVGRLAGGVAHDFNNMLSVILGHVELVLEQMDSQQPLFEDMQAIRSAARRSADLTRKLLAFARKETITPSVLDINETVEGMLKMLRRLIGEDIDLAWLPGKDVWPVKVDPSQIDHLLANLCVNARDAIEGVGKVTIETNNSTIDKSYCAEHPGFVPGEYVMLAVSDNGCGIDKEIMDNIFEPFFTLKDMEKGTGLGLAMVYGIVKQNNGFINVYSEPDLGAVFKIYLPRNRVEDVKIEDEILSDQVALGNETILLVEDEAAILKMTTGMLERYGYSVLATSVPSEAIRLAGKRADKVHLLLTDVIMPEMNGQDLARTLLSLNPGLKCLFMSGYTANVIARHGVLDDGVHFLQKPYTPQDLARKVRETLDGE
ncbi:MAG: PAS domain S-box protein [Bacteroidales bacterium]|nr:PAS domain S-box protein [Candidatus Latescibacterota bacterium]